VGVRVPPCALTAPTQCGGRFILVTLAASFQSAVMDTILVPIDFSAASRSASLYAASLARVLKSKLILFHAYMLPTPVSEVPYVMVSVNDLQGDNEAMVRREAEVLHKNFNIEVECQVRIGMPSDEITAFSDENNASLIVIGMRGAGGIDKLIGSTSASVVRKASVPVLVVPHDVVFSPPQHIVYASDLSYNSSSGLFKPLTMLASVFTATVHVLHVRKGPKATNNEKEILAKNTISALLSNVTHEFHEISDESVGHGIRTYVEQNHAQMLVMVAHKHSFFDRLFNKIHTTDMAYETRIPLLVLHDS
jgi:nucleotide-binding universal stress UspA family protein